VVTWGYPAALIKTFCDRLPAWVPPRLHDPLAFALGGGRSPLYNDEVAPNRVICWPCLHALNELSTDAAVAESLIALGNRSHEASGSHPPLSEFRHTRTELDVDRNQLVALGTTQTWTIGTCSRETHTSSMALPGARPIGLRSATDCEPSRLSANCLRAQRRGRDLSTHGSVPISTGRPVPASEPAGRFFANRSSPESAASSRWSRYKALRATRSGDPLILDVFLFCCYLGAVLRL